MTAVLVSWPYVIGAMVERLYDGLADGLIHSLLIDSGAFTAWKHGTTLDIREYIQFVKTMPFEPTGYFQLDVIGDPVATLVNLERMYDAGLKPIPVWTVGAPEEHIARMYELSPAMVALGGLVGNPPYTKHLLENLWPQDKVYHLLGVAHHGILARYRPPSTDTSSWLSGPRYGRFTLYRGNGRWHKPLEYHGRRPTRGKGRSSRITVLILMISR